VARLLEAARETVLLVTSRAPLHLSMEREFAVGPLSEADAVELFVARAAAVGENVAPDETVASICRRLDSLPLAVELAAARTKLLSPPALLDRLERALPLLTGGARDAPERQRTMRATIDWSYELLTEHERAVFRRLAVFRGGFSLDAADAVAGADLEKLASLVDKNMLTVGEDDRFQMLETICEYARDRLEEDGEAERIRERHLDYFHNLAEAARPYLVTPDEATWLDRLERELDNFRAALRFAADTGDEEAALELPIGLGRLWYIRGYIQEGRMRLTDSLTHARDPAQRVEALTHLVRFLLFQGDLDLARELVEERLILSTELQDERDIARCMNALGLIARDQGDIDTARRHFEHAIAAFRRLGGERIDIPLRNLAQLEADQGALDRAKLLCEESLAIATRIGDLEQVGVNYRTLGYISLLQGHDHEAAALLAKALATARTIKDSATFVVCLNLLAYLHSRSGRFADAATLLGRAEALQEEAGTAFGPGWRAYDDALAIMRDNLSEDAIAAAWAEGRELPLDEVLDRALRAVN
jgi:predicted ATPase